MCAITASEIANQAHFFLLFQVGASSNTFQPVVHKLAFTNEVKVYYVQEKNKNKIKLEAAPLFRVQRIRAAVAKLLCYPISPSYSHRVDNHSAAGCLTSTRKRGFSFHTNTLKNIRTFASSKVISASSKVYLNPDLDKEIIISENRNKPGIYK